MNEEFNLSEKKYNAVEFMRKLSYNPIVRYKNQTDVYQWIQEIVDLAIKQKNEDIKEFIRLLKEEYHRAIGIPQGIITQYEKEINKLAGDKLVEKGK